LREVLPGHSVACIRVPGWETAQPQITQANPIEKKL